MTKQEPVKNDISPALFICQDAPAVPAKNTDKNRASYTVGLYGAYRDCKTRLKTAGEIVIPPVNEAKRE